MAPFLKNVKALIFEKARYTIGTVKPDSMRSRFRRVYKEGLFSGGESQSGQGSGLIQTERIREEIPRMLERLGADSLVDAPCGDFFWMKEVCLPVQRYVGIDVVPELIRANRLQFGSVHRSFLEMNIIEEVVPCADIILCRDCFVHLTFEQCFRIIDNFKRSGSTYLLTTTFTDRTVNRDLDDGFWRTLNLEVPPFDFPHPESVIVEGCTECDGAYTDKSLGLWRLKHLPNLVQDTKTGGL
jgi:hypothetical protein